MNLQLLLLHEEKLIQNEINALYHLNSKNVIEQPSADIIEKINSDLCHPENNFIYKIHSNLINSLISSYLYSKGISKEIFSKNFENVSGFQELPLWENIKMEEIPSLCEELHIVYLNSRFKYQKGKFFRVKSKSNLKEKGAVYTKTHIAKEIVETTIANYTQHTANLNNIRILDFACGTGRFYENIVHVLYSQYKISTDDIILKHTFAIDIDPIAINITRLKAISWLNIVTEENIKQITRNILFRNALIRGEIFTEEDTLQEDDFGGLHKEKFDIVVSNPPYLVLKINKGPIEDKFWEKIQKQVSYFRDSGAYYYSIEGMLNYYQLSIELILTMIKPTGEIGIICPSSLFADISVTKLRKHLLLNHKVRKIKYFSEKVPLFENVTQATNIFYLQKSGVTDSIDIEESENKFKVELTLIKQLFPKQMEIPFINETGWSILQKISSKKKLKYLSSVRNRRGELDLSLYKNYITHQKTPYRLVRGNMISETGIKNINNEFVSETFLQVKSPDFMKNDFKRKRLVCQQISNGSLKKRLHFVFCDETDILGNSCNYLSGDEHILLKLKLILNSSLLNWRFKITSTNNHINNYELDELPIADLHLVDENYRYQTQKDLDEYIGRIYGLKNEELQFILQR